jgi:hypothetical protein
VSDRYIVVEQVRPERLRILGPRKTDGVCPFEESLNSASLGTDLFSVRPCGDRAPTSRCFDGRAITESRWDEAIPGVCVAAEHERRRAEVVEVWSARRQLVQQLVGRLTLDHADVMLGAHGRPRVVCRHQMSRLVWVEILNDIDAVNGVTLHLSPSGREDTT